MTPQLAVGAAVGPAPPADSVRTSAPAGRSADQAAALQSKRIICTLGMHRSGTSLVSRLLNLLGVDLGPQQSVSGAGTDNPRGYWEHHPLALLNDEILARFGGGWDEPPSFPSGWSHDPRLSDLREKARLLLNADFASAPVWGWKDPRTCLTIPFWQEIIGSMRYVICIRNPCAVVASLSHRNDMSAEKAERLWLTHVAASLAHTSGRPRMFVFYEDLIDNWAPELGRLAAFIGRPDRAADPAVLAAVGEFLEETMCHHRRSMEDLVENEQLSFATKGLYLALRGHAPRETPGEALTPDRAGYRVQRTIDLLAARALETWERTTMNAAERETLSRDNLARTAAIATVTAERSQLVNEAGALAEKVLALSAAAHARTVREARLVESIASLESDLQRVTIERDRERRDGADRLYQAIAGADLELHRVTVDRDRQAREHAVRERDTIQSIARLQADLRDATGERDRGRQMLEEIYASCAWSLVTVSRQAIAGVMPEGSSRRQWLTALIRRLARRSGGVA